MMVETERTIQTYRYILTKYTGKVKDVQKTQVVGNLNRIRCHVANPFEKIQLLMHSTCAVDILNNDEQLGKM